MSSIASNAQAKRILLSLAGVALGYSLLHSLLPMRAELAETNYHANLIRIQASVFGAPPKAVLAGSSISGRMLASYFEETRLRPLTNLGIDGSGPLFALELIADRPPAVVIIETNRLCRPAGENEAMLHEAMRTPLFRAAGHFPVLRTECRPSAMLYSWVKQHRDTLVQMTPQYDSGVRKAPTVTPLPKAELPPGFELTRDRVGAAIRGLREKGVQVLLVRIPTGGRTALEEATVQAATELGRELSIPEIDLETECLRRGYDLAFTDGTHMTPASAKQASVLLAELVEKTLDGSEVVK